jgi:biopolymer transport protein ExbD
MAIALQASGDGSEQPVSAINTTPLVDVMLVLLIIFLITIPVVNFSVPVALPKQRNTPREVKPQDVVISVDRGGRLYWLDTPLRDAHALDTRLQSLARQSPQPEVHIRGDAGSRYEPVGRVLAACQRAGILKVGFVTEPPPRT